MKAKPFALSEILWKFLLVVTSFLKAHVTHLFVIIFVRMLRAFVYNKCDLVHSLYFMAGKIRHWSYETSTADWIPDEPPQGPDVGLTINAVLKIIFYIAVIIIGLIGNGLILGVYWPKPNKTSTHILIMGLAGMDFTVCLMRVYNLTVYVFVLENKKTPSALEYLGAIGLVNVFASSVLTGFIAVDRYDCVCRPRNRLLNRFRAKMMILSAYAGAMLFASPRILEIIWLPSTLALQRTFLIFQFVLYIFVLGAICVCYGHVYNTIRKHVKVNVLSQRPAQNDLSVASSSQHATIPAIAVKVPLSGPSSGDGGQPSTSKQQETTETIDTPAGVANESLHRKDQSATQGNDNSTQTNRPPDGNVKPNKPKKGKDKTVSLQRKTTRMMFGTSVVLLVTWFPYWLYVALNLARVYGAIISFNVTRAVYYFTITVYINNILNPLIYGLANRRFRKDCLSALKKMRKC
ncbi:G-protein coupled receptor 84-like [Asterias rubens]|uniref:G-protein coupled receptor 84-like n=1 Tax=Asterias rubens TaxID=7604 RepID=UPI001454F7EA|nr:G-protein coupled receptor 84-like [Asterias rubens]